MDRHYLRRRNGRNDINYRLRKRTATVIDYISKYVHDGIDCTLDIGTADGRMLSMVSGVLQIRFAIGIDTMADAVEIAQKIKNDNLEIFQGNAAYLPFKNNTFDIVLASAVIEHIENADMVIHESGRVLKKGGLLCITIPNPFHDWIASRVAKTYHVRRYTLAHMKKTLKNQDFNVLKADYFMLCPFGAVPFEDAIIRCLQHVRFGTILWNQIIVASKQ